MRAAERIADLSVLWREASVVFPFFDRGTVDWDAVYREYLDKVLRTEDERAFHLLLAEFLNRLGDGHTDYTPPKALVEQVGFLPFSLKYVDGGYCVRAVRQGEERLLGSRVLRINGSTMEQLVGELARYSYHVDGFLSRPNLFLPFLLKKSGNTLETSAGTWGFDLEASVPEMTAVEAPAAPVSYEVIPTEKLELRVYEGGILVVKLNDFLCRGAADEIRGALQRCSGLNGVILDVRENIGGMTKFAAEAAELFLTGEVSYLCKHTQSVTGSEIASAGQILLMPEEERCKWCGEEELEDCRRISRRAKYKEWVGTVGTAGHQALYDGPCVILTSRYTVSAAEDFVAMFRSAGRADVMGEATQGTTGTPRILSLTCGGRARICSIGNRLIDGTEFVGRGIEPDITLVASAEDYAAGRDRILACALKKLTN